MSGRKVRELELGGGFGGGQSWGGVDAGDEMEEKEDGGEVEVGWIHCLDSEEGIERGGIMEIKFESKELVTLKCVSRVEILFHWTLDFGTDDMCAKSRRFGRIAKKR